MDTCNDIYLHLIYSTEKDKLQEFQNKQKQIEELNKKKRAELSFQIKERFLLVTYAYRIGCFN